MKVCVQGLWHLGSVTAACLASVGHEVVGLDFDAAAIAKLNCGEAPVLEPGLNELIDKGLRSRKLSFTASVTEAVKDIEVLWVAYDTPVDSDDIADTDFVFGQIERVLPILPPGAMILVSSQLPVGTISRLEKLAKANFDAKKLVFACCPENLRLGKALEAFLDPDRIVVGVRSAQSKQCLTRLLMPVSERIEWMTVESAEMTKHAVNAFLAASVTFANEVASICEQVGADAKEVERGLKTERRIGPRAYLSPGAAFAGGTLARDVSFLTQVARKNNLVAPLLTSIKLSNDEHSKWVKRKLLVFFPDLSRISIAVWGLTYKPGTDTLRRSAAVELCNWLIERGAEVRLHDPAVVALPVGWSGKVQRFDEPASAVLGAQVLIVATEWPLYREVAGDSFPGSLIVLDPNRFLVDVVARKGLRYVAVGTSGAV